MSLEISSNKIIIHNAAGVEKFNSSQRLLYQTGYASGTNVSLNSTTLRQAISHGLTYDPSKDIAIPFITLTSGGGTIGTSILNVRMPAQGTVPIDFYARNVNNRPAIDGSWITTFVNDKYIFLRGCHTPYNHPPLYQANGINYSIVLNWELFVYRYTI
jgi:hypothetical protein